MAKITKQNIRAIFGRDSIGIGLQIDCKITGRLTKPIKGSLALYPDNPADLWVWTSQPRRVTQDVIAHIDLSQTDALNILKRSGITILAPKQDATEAQIIEADQAEQVRRTAIATEAAEATSVATTANILEYRNWTWTSTTMVSA
jgi:hypothetical protein